MPQNVAKEALSIFYKTESKPLPFAFQIIYTILFQYLSFRSKNYQNRCIPNSICI